MMFGRWKWPKKVRYDKFEERYIYDGSFDTMNQNAILTSSMQRERISSNIK